MDLVTRVLCNRGMTEEGGLQRDQEDSSTPSTVQKGSEHAVGSRPQSRLSRKSLSQESMQGADSPGSQRSKIRISQQNGSSESTGAEGLKSQREALLAVDGTEGLGVSGVGEGSEAAGSRDRILRDEVGLLDDEVEEISLPGSPSKMSPLAVAGTRLDPDETLLHAEKLTQLLSNMPDPEVLRDGHGTNNEDSFKFAMPKERIQSNIDSLPQQNGTLEPAKKIVVGEDDDENDAEYANSDSQGVRVRSPNSHRNKRSLKILLGGNGAGGEKHRTDKEESVRTASTNVQAVNHGWGAIPAPAGKPRVGSDRSNPAPDLAESRNTNASEKTGKGDNETKLTKRGLSGSEQMGKENSMLQALLVKIHSVTDYFEFLTYSGRPTFFRGGRIIVPAKKILLNEETKIAREEVKRTKPARHVRFRLKRSKQYYAFQLFEPNSPFIHHWLMFMVIPLAYEVWAFPFRLGFGVPGGGISMVLLWDLISDSFFLLDMAVALLTVVPPGTYKNQPDSLTTVRWIGRAYMIHVFPFQLLPSIVYYIVTGLVAGTCNDICWIWWAASVPRLLPRFVRLMAYFRKMVNDVQVSIRTLQGVKFSLILFLSAHWTGCIYYWLARLQHPSSDRTWVYDFEGLLPLYQVDQATVAEDYLLCLYKGFNALSNLEYDYGLPANPIEMIWSFVVMGFQVYMSALVLGTLLNYLVSKDPVAEAHKKRMENLALYCDAKQLPYDLRERMYQHFTFQYKKNVQNKEGATMDLPRALQIRVADCKYRSVIEKCCLRGNPFFGCDKQFLNALLVHLKIVHLMPGEEFVEHDGIPRELYFVFQGTVQVVDEENRVKRVIRNDVPDMAPMVGEVPFFLGLNHPHSIRAQPDGDVQLLMLSREKSDELFMTYPEMHEIISQNILATFGLDLYGDALENAQEDPDADRDKLQLKETIIHAIHRKMHEQFATLLFAASQGDVEKVALLLRRGADIDEQDYDGNTVLHFASAAGDYRLIEMLLDKGASRNIKNRWHHTPLQEAINNKQSLVVELLCSYKAKLDVPRPAEALCQAASSGDLESLRRFIENGVNVNAGDYDLRTALHLAAAEGEEKITEYLLSKKADPNCKDRWGGTPLQDAVMHGHSNLASLLRNKGSELPQGLGIEQICDAAGKGDVRKLRLLHECGEAVDQGDYDARYPLHIASAEGRVLAVNYLLSISADPNCQDRWGMRPLDDALKGGTLYHLYCGKLIQCWGGKSGSSSHSQASQQLLDQLDTISISDVRSLIKRLIKDGYEMKVPSVITERENTIVKETVLQQIPLVQALKGTIGQVTDTLTDIVCVGSEAIDALKESLMSLAAKIDDEAQAKMKRTSCYSPIALSRGPEVIAKTPKSISRVNGAFVVDEQTKEQATPLFLRCLQALNNLDQAVLHGDEEAEIIDGLDSDEEAELYEELDQLVEAQERAQKAGTTGDKIAAQAFQRGAMKIIELGSMFETLCAVVHNIQGNKETDFEPALSVDDFGQLLDVLGAENTEHLDLDEIFEEGHEFHLKFGSHDLAIAGKVLKAFKTTPRVPLTSLLAGSQGFRKVLSSLTIDQDLCRLMDTRVSEVLTEFELRSLLPMQRVTWEAGQICYDCRTATSANWYVVIAGASKVYSASEEYRVRHSVLDRGDCFGAWSFLMQEQDEIPPFTIRATEQVMAYEIPLSSLMEVLQGSHFRAISLAKRMGECPMPHAKGSKRKSDQGTKLWSALRVTVKTISQVQSLHSNGQPGSKWGQPSKPDSNWINQRDSGPELDEGTPIGVGESEKRSLKELVHQIDHIWTNFAMGSSTFSRSHLRHIHKLLGEVSSECFSKMFFSSPLPETITADRFWKYWIDFLSEEVFGTLQSAEDTQEEKEEGIHTVDAQTGPNEGDNGITTTMSYETDVEEEVDCLEHIHARFASSRSLKPRFFEEDIVDQYEIAWEKVCGSKKNALPYNRIPSFLAHVFLDFGYRVTDKNAKEFLRAFGKDDKTASVAWNDVSRALRDRRTGVSDAVTGPFVGSALNPTWPMMYRWERIIKLCAIYYLAMVPVRIAFIPWDSMETREALLSDGLVDILVTINLILKLNTAYKNSKSKWQTSRLKIITKVPYAFIVAALPFDWWGHWLGSDNETSCWMRVPKLFLIIGVRIELGGRSKSALRLKLETMCRLCALILHWSACVWFYIGREYPSWFPSQPVTWYMVDESLESSTFDREMLYGFAPTATVWDKYLLSLYWVAATLTVNGLIGDVIPQNYLEIGFTIILMILNMTIVKWVLGEVSTIVMNADNDIVQTREQLELVDSFVYGNHLPDELQSDIKAHYHALSVGHTVDQSQIFAGMSHSLQVEVASFVSREYLDGIELFKGCSDRLLDAISVLLREVHFSPGQFIFEESEAADEMFFMQTGLVEEVTTKDGEVLVDRTVKAPSSLGGLAFIFGLRHYYSARASKTSSVTCLKLEKAQFSGTMKLFHEEQEMIAQNAIEFMETVHKSRAGSRVGSRKSTGSRRSNRSSKKSEPSMSAAGSATGSAKTQDNNQSVGNASASGEGMPEGEQEDPDKKNTDDGDGITIDSSEVSDDKQSFIGAEDGKRGDKVSELKARRQNQLLNAFLTAAGQNKLEAVKKYLESGDVTIRAQDGHKRTALHVACSQGHNRVVEFLLEKGADVQAKDKYGNTPFVDAVRHHHDATCKIVRETNPNATYQLKGKGVAVELCQTAWEGDLTHLKRLVLNGCNVNEADYDGRTAIHLAACEGHVKIVEFLLHCGADINAVDNFGGTALQDAVRHHHSQVQSLLREKGARLETGNTDFATKLCKAAAEGDLPTIQTLAANGVQLIQGDYDGRTCLHQAAAYEKVSILEYLFKVDPPICVNPVDRYGDTPLDDARRQNCLTARTMLEQNGGLLNGDDKLAELLGAQKEQELAKEKAIRQPLVKQLFDFSPENRAIGWLKDKLEPNLRDKSSSLLQFVQKLEWALTTIQGPGAGSVPASGNVTRTPSFEDSNTQSEPVLLTLKSGPQGPTKATPPGEVASESVGQSTSKRHSASGDQEVRVSGTQFGGLPLDDPRPERSCAPDRNAPFQRSSTSEIPGAARASEHNGVGLLAAGAQPQASKTGLWGAALSMATPQASSFGSLVVREKNRLSALEKSPYAVDKIKAAEQILHFIPDVKAQIRECMCIFESMNEDGGAPIDCKIWKMLSDEYLKKTKQLKHQLRVLTELCKLSKKLMKELSRLQKRKEKARMFAKTYRNLRPSHSMGGFGGRG